MTIPLTCALPRRLQLPTRTCWGKSIPAFLRKHAVPIWHCSRWGLPCRPCCQRRGGLLPHLFTLTLADQRGLFSVALSVEFPRPGVTRHRCLLESGLSSQGAGETRARKQPSSLPREDRPSVSSAMASTGFEFGEPPAANCFSQKEGRSPQHKAAPWPKGDSAVVRR